MDAARAVSGVQKASPTRPSSLFVTLEAVAMTARQVTGARTREEESPKWEFQGSELDHRGKRSRNTDQVEKASKW